MTLTTDLVHDVIGYLVTQCQSSVLLGAAVPPVAIADGPIPPGEIFQTSQQRVSIGYDTISAAPEAGIARSRWPFLGTSGAYREETGDIVCTAEAWTGDTAPTVARAACKTLVGAVENMLRGYPPNGPGDSSMGGLVQWSQVEGPFTWTQKQDNNGFSAACVFHVTYLARLAPN